MTSASPQLGIILIPMTRPTKAEDIWKVCKRQLKGSHLQRQSWIRTKMTMIYIYVNVHLNYVSANIPTQVHH